MRRFRGVVTSCLALFSILASSSALAWWNDDWAYRKEITFDLSPTGAAIGGSATDVPVLVRLSLGNFAYFGDTKPDGSDLRFIAADDKTPLKFHVERYDAEPVAAGRAVRLGQEVAGAHLKPRKHRHRRGEQGRLQRAQRVTAGLEALLPQG